VLADEQAGQRAGGADLAGDDAEGLLADAPADPGGRLGMGGVAVQHARCQVTAEGHLGELVFSELDYSSYIRTG
jgi:hypothetical protein